MVNTLRRRRRLYVPSPGTIQYQFVQFDLQNPQVYDALVEMCFKYVDYQNSHPESRETISIRLLYAMLRHNGFTKSISWYGNFKLPEIFSSRYARKIIRDNPELRGVFKLAKIRTA